jgi:large-conductance mechanosensitive channel
MKKFLAIILTIFFALNTLFILPVSANGKGICGFLPCDQSFTAETGSPQEIALSFGRFFASLIFVGIIAFGIFQVIRASLKIIRSEGDSSKIQDGADTLKGVMIGIGMIFVGLIGLVIILAFFGAEGVVNTPVPPTPGL